MTYTTELKIEPARLQVHIHDISEAEDLLNTAGVQIPEHVDIVEAETLPGGGVDI